MQKTHFTNKIRFFLSILLFGFTLVFYGNFFGIDLSDEGLAILSFMPEQELGTDFIHYQYLIRAIFPSGISFVMARQIHLILVLLSNCILLFSIYRSRFNKSFEHTVLLIGATSLISLSNGIQILSYNNLNQIIITLFFATFIQFIDVVNWKKQVFWLIAGTILISSMYFIRFPSFILYLPLHFISILIIVGKNYKKLIKNFFVISLVYLLTILFLSSNLISISRVINDIELYSKISSEQTNGHGIRLIFEYIFDFIRKCILLFFTATSFLVLNNFIKKVSPVFIKTLLKVCLYSFIIIMIVSFPISISSAFVFFFWLLVVSYYSSQRKTIDLTKEKKIPYTFIFVSFAVASTIGSNVMIINLLLYYLSIWAIAFNLFLIKKNLHLYRISIYILVFLAVLKVIFTGFISPHRQGSLLSPHYRYEMKSRGSILLDKEMYEYVIEIRSYLESENQYNKPIIAMSRLPGLVYLLESTMPGSINFTDDYWKVFCENINPNTNKKPVLIFRGNIPDDFIKCLAEKKILIENEYKLGKKVEKGINIYQIPTYIYVPIYKEI